MNNTEIINFLKDNPGATAAEIGTTSVEMGRLAKKGIVEKVGNRSTGTRGRPPAEWALPGQEIAEREDVREHVAPKLPTIPDNILRAMSAEHLSQIKYIQGEFANVHGIREKDDYALLRDRYDRIVRSTALLMREPTPIYVEDEQEDENDAS